MKKGKQAKRVLASATVATLVMSTVMAVPAQAAKRYEGKGRVQTALSVSKEWTKSDVAIIAPADDANLVDALAVSPLAKSCDAPILLNFKGDTLDNDVKAELNRLGVKKVYIATGNGILTQKFEDAVKKEVKDVARLGGKDKFATSLNIAKELNSKNKVKDVCIVNGLADALAVASFAGQKNMPILLTNGKELTADVKAFLNEVKPENTFVIGGTGVISEDLCKEVKGKRLAGADRFATNRAILNNFVAEGTTFDTVFVASGSDAHLVDALAGSALAAKQGAPVVLAGETLSSEQAKEIKNLLKEGKEATILGGNGAVSDSIKADIVKIEKGETEAEFKVESVEALNAKQIQVKFSQKVDADSAEEENHYKVDGDDSVVKAELEDDCKTVTLTLAKKLTDSNKDYTIKVTEVRKDNSGDIIPAFAKVVSLKDDKDPEVKEIECKTNKSTADRITVKFNEPVNKNESFIIKVDDDSYTLNHADVSVKEFDNVTDGIKEVTIKGLDLDAAKKHTVKVMGIKDFAGNMASDIVKEISVEKDTTAPQVSEVKAYTDNAIYVKFNKKMDKETLNKDNISVRDQKDEVVDVAFVATPDELDDDFEYVIVLKNNIYSSDDIKNLNVTFKDSIKDDFGNEIKDSIVKSVKMTKDKTKPVIKKAYAVKDEQGNLSKIVAYTDKTILPGNSSLDDFFKGEKLNDLGFTREYIKNHLTITDKNGTKLEDTKDFEIAGDYAGNKDGVQKSMKFGDKKIEILFNTANKKLDKGSYDVILNSKLVKDCSVKENSNDNFKFNIKLDEKTNDWNFKGNINVENDKVIINFGAGVTLDADSAKNLNNYSISGLSNLEDLKKANIYLNADQNEVTIDLSGIDIKDDKDNAITIKNIKKVNGDVMKSYFANLDGKLKSNVKPKLVTVTKGEVKDGNDTIASLTQGDLVFTAKEAGKTGLKVALTADEHADKVTAKFENNTVTVSGKAAELKADAIKKAIEADPTCNSKISVATNSGVECKKVTLAKGSDAGDVKTPAKIKVGNLTFTAKISGVEMNDKKVVIEVAGTEEVKAEYAVDTLTIKCSSAGKLTAGAIKSAVEASETAKNVFSVEIEDGNNNTQQKATVGDQKLQGGSSQHSDAKAAEATIGNLTFKAKTGGVAGNAINVEVKEDANLEKIKVEVVGNAITVSGKKADLTANNIAAAINKSDKAKALVTAEAKAVADEKQNVFVATELAGGAYTASYEIKLEYDKNVDTTGFSDIDGKRLQDAFVIKVGSKEISYNNYKESTIERWGSDNKALKLTIKGGKNINTDDVKIKAKELADQGIIVDASGNGQDENSKEFTIKK